VRSSGVSNYVDVGLRELVRKDAIAGPDVLASGYHVRPVVAEDAFFGDPTLANLMGGVRTPADLVQIVRANLGHGVDWIKVLATDRAGLPDTDPRQQVLSDAQLRAVVEEAGTKRVPVQAHAHGDEGAMAAVRAGVRSIEHGTYLSDATLTLMKEKGTFLVPTYTTTFDLVEPGGDYDNPVLHLRGVHMLAVQREMIHRAQKIGVKIVTGADTGYGPTSVTRISTEIVNFVDIGLSPLAALQSATTVAAELLGIEKQTGAIEAGLEADLIVVDSNPLQNVGVLRDPLLIVSNGHIAVDRLTFGK
ncbi:MAG: amidohydrolase family protein, partial [Acidobacteria bacterium]|nr:amidohydrolase family protein [Acidobacteriota bacterium]